MTEGEYRNLCEDSAGLCCACGEHNDCIEPDARGRRCDICDKRSVCGIEEVLLDGRISFTTEGE